MISSIEHTPWQHLPSPPAGRRHVVPSGWGTHFHSPSLQPKGAQKSLHSGLIADWQQAEVGMHSPSGHFFVPGQQSSGRRRRSRGR